MRQSHQEHQVSGALPHTKPSTKPSTRQAAQQTEAKQELVETPQTGDSITNQAEEIAESPTPEPQKAVTKELTGTHKGAEEKAKALRVGMDLTAA